MPIKSHVTETLPRPYRSIIQDSAPEPSKHSYYQSLTELVRRVENLKSISDWTTEITDGKLILCKSSESLKTDFPLFTVTIDDGLGFTVQVYNCFVPEDHQLYKKNKRSMTNISVSDLVNSLLQYNLCNGIDVQANSDVYFHVVH